MERQFLTEFDFTREGWALDTIGGPVNAKFGPDVHVPRPYRQLCSRRVCVMERLDDHVKLGAAPSFGCLRLVPLTAVLRSGWLAVVL